MKRFSIVASLFILINGWSILFSTVNPIANGNMFILDPQNASLIKEGTDFGEKSGYDFVTGCINIFANYMRIYTPDESNLATSTNSTLLDCDNGIYWILNNCNKSGDKEKYCAFTEWMYYYNTARQNQYDLD